MLTATSPLRPACSLATRINSPCALCSAPMVGTSTRGWCFTCDWAPATVVRTFTLQAFLTCLQCANHEVYLARPNANRKLLRDTDFDKKPIAAIQTSDQ